MTNKTTKNIIPELHLTPAVNSGNPIIQTIAVVEHKGLSDVSTASSVVGDAGVTRTIGRAKNSHEVNRGQLSPAADPIIRRRATNGVRRVSGSVAALSRGMTTSSSQFIKQKSPHNRAVFSLCCLMDTVPSQLPNTTACPHNKRREGTRKLSANGFRSHLFVTFLKCSLCTYNVRHRRLFVVHAGSCKHAT
jgi:hypothetical protein